MSCFKDVTVMNDTVQTVGYGNVVPRSYPIAVHTAFSRSYSVEALNSLTSFVDFRFKDRFLKKKLAQFTFWFYETDFS